VKKKKGWGGGHGVHRPETDWVSRYARPTRCRLACNRPRAGRVAAIRRRGFDMPQLCAARTQVGVPAPGP